MKRFYQLAARYSIRISTLFIALLFLQQAPAQTTLAAGDIAFVGYIATDDGVNGTTQDDEFSFVLLKDIAAGTTIRFTDFGWLTAGGFQTANACGPNTGAINDGIITWTASAAMACGTQVTIQCKYTLVASSGTVNGTQATSNNPAAYLSLATGGDQIFAYQGTHAAPVFLAGISLNKSWDASLTSCFFSSNSSVLPAALNVATANNIALTSAINARYNCSISNAVPSAMISAVNTVANWQTDNTYFVPIPAAFQLPLPCSFGCNSAIINVTGTLNPFITCQGTASAEQSYSVAGTNLTANLTINAPVGFEISTTSGSGFTNMISLVPSGGNVGATTIYVRLAASATGTPAGNITHSSAGATTQNLAVSGTVNPLPNAVANPASQTVCTQDAITTIVLSGAVGNTTFNWTRDNTATVTGIASSGSGNISGTLTNTTSSPVTVTFTITPTANGCDGSSITATVVVNPDPTITCPGNISVNAAAGQCTAVVNYTVNSTGFPSPTLSYSFSGATTGSGSGSGSGSTFNAGTTTVMVTATNSCAAVNCSFIVTVADSQNPVITCPAPVSVDCAAGVPAPNTSLVTATDNCPGVTVAHISDVISNQVCTNRYTITRTYRATDASGNTAECTQAITVNDQTAPVITCPAPMTVSCAAAVPAANPGAINASDNCGSVTVTHQGDVISNQACANQYTITRTYRATDACGNFAECTQVIIVNDQQAPVLTCPAPITVNCASEVPAANPGSITATDNCGAVTVTHQGDVISNQTCANRYTITRTYRATDACGNFAECNQVITVNDQTAPVITCPAPVTVSCASQVPAANPASVTATDNCGAVTVTHVGDVVSGQTCANRYTITRTYRATDACGNFAECIQMITVNDQTAPVITCPAPVTVSCASQVPAANPASVTATDNCGAVTVTHIGDVISGQTCANRYTITRTYRATDACGNFAECTQVITVNDQTAPVITCPANITVTCASAVPAPNIAAVTASDNCGGSVTIVHVGDVISNQTCPNRYTITRTYRATDVCGNTATCTQTITVNDQVAPAVTCPANITVTTPVGSCTAVVNFTPTATDNCGGNVSISSIPASGSAFPIGTTTVTVTATDACGNSSTCTFTVTVIDAQLPVISTQPASVSICAGANATFNVVATNATGYQWQQFSGGSWQNISGATAASYTVNNVTTAMNTNSFRVIVQGLCTNITSGTATLMVKPRPIISISSSPTQQLLPGQVLTLTATANPGGGSFAWYRDGVLVAGATGPVLSQIGIDDLGSYYVIYTDPSGCSSQSNAIVVSALASDNLYVFPNPNHGEFQVRYFNQTGETITVAVYDMKGSEIYRKREAGTQPYTGVEVDITGVPSGNYLVVVFNGNGEKVGSKIIVVRL